MKKNFEEFKKQVVSAMKGRMENMDFTIRIVEKLQEQSYTGLAVSLKGSHMAAMVNLDVFYDRYRDGQEEDTVMDEIERAVRSAVRNFPEINTDDLTDYNAMQKTMMVQLVAVSANEKKLSKVPHEVIGDMALVCRMEMARSEDGNASILVTDALLKTYGITAAQLMGDALREAERKHPAILRNMAEIFGFLGGPGIGESPLWVASTEDGLYGAAVVRYPGFLKKVAEKLGGSFFALPSSIHEWIFVLDNGAFSAENLSAMVREVNGSEVDPADRLSDQAYYYDAEEQIFETAADHKIRAELREAEIHERKEAEAAETEGTISVLIVEPGKHPHTAELHTGLGDLQSTVGGLIEAVYPFTDRVAVIVNEEGKLNGLPLNRAIRDEDGEMQDIIAGTFIVAGLTEENFGSLTPEQAEKYQEMFWQPEDFIRLGKELIAVPVPEEELIRRAAAAPQ